METKKTWVNSSDWPDFVELPATLDYTKKIYPRVLEAQEVDLREAVGWDFYRELAAVLSNSNTVSGATVDGDAISFTQSAYDALTDYLKPVIIHYAYARHIELFGIENTRYGQRQKQSPHSKEPSDKAIDRQLHRHRGMSSHYLVVLRKYIQDNASDYPKYYGLNSEKLKGTPAISSIWERSDKEDWDGFPYGSE